jgi:hypothetical protein
MVEAWIVFDPTVEDVITTSQLPLPAVGVPVVQFCETGVAAPEITVTVQVVPSGAFTNPVPSLTLIWQCNVCGAPTAFVAVAGVIWMFASTQVLLALPEPPEAVFCAVPVVRVIVTPLTGMSDVAWTTVVPATAELIVTVQLAVAAPPV